VIGVTSRSAADCDNRPSIETIEIDFRLA